MHLRFLSACKQTEPLCPSRHPTPADIHLQRPLLRDSLQLTRQHLIATPFLAALWDSIRQMMPFSYRQLISVIKCVDWGPRKGGGREPKRWRAHPLHKNFAGALSTSMKLNTCDAASREVCSAFGCGWRAGPSPDVRWRHYSLQAPAQSEIGVKLNHMLIF